MPQNSALTSAGAELYLTLHLTLLAKFDGEFAPGSQRAFLRPGSGTLRFSWCSRSTHRSSVSGQAVATGASSAACLLQ